MLQIMTHGNDVSFLGTRFSEEEFHRIDDGGHCPFCLSAPMVSNGKLCSCCQCLDSKKYALVAS